MTTMCTTTAAAAAAAATIYLFNLPSTLSVPGTNSPPDIIPECPSFAFHFYSFAPLHSAAASCKGKWVTLRNTGAAQPLLCKSEVHKLFHTMAPKQHLKLLTTDPLVQYQQTMIQNMERNFNFSNACSCFEHLNYAKENNSYMQK